MNAGTIVSFFEALLQLGAQINRDYDGDEKLNKDFLLVLSAITLGKALIQQGDVARTELEKLTADIKAMVAEGRNPTAEEIEAMKARFEASYNVAVDYLKSQDLDAPELPLKESDAKESDVG